MSAPKRKARPGIVRSEVFAMRFDKELKKQVEDAAKADHRSLANFIEHVLSMYVMGQIK